MTIGPFIVLTASYRNSLNILSNERSFICEDHFSSDELLSHNESKRLASGALPIYFPEQKSITIDHSYVRMGVLELVSKFIICV